MKKWKKYKIISFILQMIALMAVSSIANWNESTYRSTIFLILFLCSYLRLTGKTNLLPFNI